MIEIETPRLKLRPITEDDITETYVNWLNDKNFKKHLNYDSLYDIESVKQWVKDYNADDTKMLFGIFVNSEHIGNVTFYMINYVDKSLRVGIAIGQKQGQGYGYEALTAMIKYATDVMGFQRIEAGIKKENKVSVKLFKKAGFNLAGNDIYYRGKVKERTTWVRFKEGFDDIFTVIIAFPIIVVCLVCFKIYDFVRYIWRSK